MLGRVKLVSAEMSSVRTGSANSKRGGQSELWALRDTVLQLQEEVLLSRAELDKSTKQFDALINLVRK